MDDAMRHRATLVLALLLALAIDLPGMFQGIWLDEWATIQACECSYQRCMEIAQAEPPPPGYYFLNWLVFQAIPSGPFAVRLLSLTGHLMAIVFLHGYALEFHDPRIATISSLALAANPTMVWFATNGRCYGLVVGVAMGCVLAYRRRSPIPFALSTALLGWLHYFALLLPTALYILEVFRRRTFRNWMTCAGILAFVLWAPLLPHVFFSTLERPMRFERFDLMHGILTLKWWLGLDQIPATALLVVLPILSLALLLRIRFYVLEAWVWLSIWATLAVTSIWLFPVYHEKLFVFTLPLAQICVAACLSRHRLWPLAWLWLLAVVYAGFCVSGMPKTGDLKAAQALARRFGPQDRILLNSRAAEGPLSWYLPRLGRSGKGPPSTWVVGARTLPGSEDPDVTFRLLRFPGVSRTIPTTWIRDPAQIIEPETNQQTKP